MPKVFWDKGHGGEDPGAIGQGLLEKKLTAKIVDYGMAYLKNYIVEQKTSRTGDETKSLPQRSNEANAWGADILISVHINSATDVSANGFESFVHTSPKSASVALQNVTHEEIMKVNKAFGISRDRGKKRANFHMVREGRMPSILTENLFIVNSVDAKRLKDETYLKAVGEAHAHGAVRHLGLKQKSTPIIETQKKEEPFMLEKAVVINSFADFPVSELLARRLNAPIYLRATAEGKKVSKELYVVGGANDKLVADKITLLSGADRFETAAAVKKFLG